MRGKPAATSRFMWYSGDVMRYRSPPAGIAPGEPPDRARGRALASRLRETLPLKPRAYRPPDFRTSFNPCLSAGWVHRAAPKADPRGAGRVSEGVSAFVAVREKPGSAGAGREPPTQPAARWSLTLALPLTRTLAEPCRPGIPEKPWRASSISTHVRHAQGTHLSACRS